MDELTTRIDLYLSNQLSDAERKDFEEQMKKDKALTNKVQLQRKVVDLLEANAWLETKHKVNQLNKQNETTTKTEFILRIAAIFIGLVMCSAVYMSYQLSNKQLYMAYSVTYPDRISVMGERSTDFSEVMEYYNREEYEMAVELLRALKKNGLTNDLLIVYESISLQRTGRASESIQLIENYKQQQNTLEEVLAWNLIMSYIAAGNDKKAHELLLEYEEKGYSYQNQSARLLKEDLESFWRF